MTRLKLGPIRDDKPVKLTVELTADIHRDLCDYAAVLGQQTGQELEPARLVAPMLDRFMATDRGFSAARKATGRRDKTTSPSQS
ncbi:MAG: DUF2274 domain-containing protein [Pseudomonadota bacterium]